MMIAILIICITIILLSIFLLKYIDYVEELDLYNEKINVSLKSITIAIEKKEDYLEKSIDIIKDSNKKKYGKKDILGDLIKNKNKKLKLSERIKALECILKEFNELIEDDNKLKENKKIIEIIYDLTSNDNDLSASIKFYNSTLNEINKRKKNFLINLIWKKKEYKEHNEIIIQKEKEFEILKEGK